MRSAPGTTQLVVRMTVIGSTWACNLVDDPPPSLAPDASQERGVMVDDAGEDGAPGGDESASFVIGRLDCDGGESSPRFELVPDRVTVIQTSVGICGVAYQEVLLRNATERPLQLLGLEVKSPLAGVSSDQLGLEIAAGEYATVRLTRGATAPGRYSTSLTVATGDSCETHPIGVLAADEPAILVGASAVDFGTIAPGTRSDSYRLSVAAVGRVENGSTELSPASVSPTDAFQILGISRAAQSAGADCGPSFEVEIAFVAGSAQRGPVEGTVLWSSRTRTQEGDFEAISGVPLYGSVQ